MILLAVPFLPAVRDLPLFRERPVVRFCSLWDYAAPNVDAVFRSATARSPHLEGSTETVRQLAADVFPGGARGECIVLAALAFAVVLLCARGHVRFLWIPALLVPTGGLSVAAHALGKFHSFNRPPHHLASWLPDPPSNLGHKFAPWAWSALLVAASLFSLAAVLERRARLRDVKRASVFD